MKRFTNQFQTENYASSLLTAEEEKELGKLIKRGGAEGIQAKNMLIEANRRLVKHCACKYVKSGMEFDDLVSYGNAGLIHAAEKYDYTFDNKFSTYAVNWINQYIQRGIDKEISAIRIPSKKRLEGVANYTILSLDKVVGEDGDTVFGDFIPDESADDSFENIYRNDLSEIINRELLKLSPREEMVIRKRMGFDGGDSMTLEAIAKLPEFNTSKECIRQIEAKALRKMRLNKELQELNEDYSR